MTVSESKPKDDKTAHIKVCEGLKRDHPRQHSAKRLTTLVDAEYRSKPNSQVCQPLSFHMPAYLLASLCQHLACLYDGRVWCSAFASSAFYT